MRAKSARTCWLQGSFASSADPPDLLTISYYTSVSIYNHVVDCGQQASFRRGTFLGAWRSLARFGSVNRCRRAGSSGHQGREARNEAAIRMALEDLGAQLDAAQLARVHHFAAVSASSIDRFVRGANETARIHVIGRGGALPLSRNYLRSFRQL